MRIDTNVLAGTLTTRGLCAELFDVVLQSRELLISDHVLLELERIPPGKLGQSQPVADGFVSLLRSEALPSAAQQAVPSLPDLDDEVIVASALAGDADVFVTGDKALLELQRIEKMPIISPRRLWGMLAERA